jgi:hypothetical protein
MPDIKKNRRKRTELRQKSAPPLYWGLKSRNEQYFQIASVFREVSQNDTWLAEAWMHRILMARHPEHPDNTSRTSI